MSSEEAAGSDTGRFLALPPRARTFDQPTVRAVIHEQLWRERKMSDFDFSGLGSSDGGDEFAPDPDTKPDELEHYHGTDTLLGTVDEPPGARHRGMISSPHSSPRGGKAVKWVVIHTAEGARTVESLGAFFAKPATQASSHVGIDDHRIETYVDYSRAAWTLRGGNAISDNAELCGFARWTREEWLRDHPRMLELAAQWIAERCKVRGVPLVKLSPADVAAGKSGVIGHVDYTMGAKDGTHTDPGAGFPWDYVMELARGDKNPATPPGGPLPGPWISNGSFPPGAPGKHSLSCPVGPEYLAKSGWLTLSVGFADADRVGVYFIARRLPNGTKVYLPGGERGFVLPSDDPRVWAIPPGTKQISVEYVSANGIGWSLETFGA